MMRHTQKMLQHAAQRMQGDDAILRNMLSLARFLGPPDPAFFFLPPVAVQSQNIVQNVPDETQQHRTDLSSKAKKKKKLTKRTDTESEKSEATTTTEIVPFAMGLNPTQIMCENVLELPDQSRIFQKPLRGNANYALDELD